MQITLDYVRDLVVELFGVEDSEIDNHELVLKYKDAVKQNPLLDGKAFLAKLLVTARIVESFGVD